MMERMRCLALALVIFLLGTSQAFAQWTATGGPYGGNISRLKKAPNGNLYAVVNQKLWRSTNNGDLWAEVIPTSPTTLYLNDIMIDSDGKLYAAYWSQLFSSSDNGVTWTTLATNIFQNVRAIERVGPDNVFAAWGNSGLYISIDKGVSWTQISTVSSYGEPGLWTNAAGDIFYSTWQLLYKHTYKGLTTNWNSSNMTPLTLNLTNEGVKAIAFDQTGQMHLALNYNYFVSPDNGGTFTSISSRFQIGVNTLSYFRGVISTASNGTIYYFANDAFLSGAFYKALYKSTDNGLTWTVATGPTNSFGADATNLVFISASTLVLGSVEGVFRSTDSGANWLFKSNGLIGATTDQIAVTTTGKIIVGKYGQGYTYSSDGGATWLKETIGVTTTIRKVLKLTNGNILLYGSGYVWRSTDNATIFSSDLIYRSQDNSIIEAANGDLYLSYSNYVNPNYVAKIARSTDSGATWTDLTITGLPANCIINYAAIDGTTNMIINCYDYGASAYKTFKIVGTTATLLTMPNTSNYNNLFFANNKFYASQFSSYYYTTDLGTTWTTVGFSGNYVFPIRNATYSGIAVSRAGSLYISQDDGGTWGNTTLPSSSAYITNIATDAAGDFYASANGSAVLKFTNELLVDPTTLPPYINFNWQPLNGPYGGNVSKVEIHPDGATLYSISQSRLWKNSTGTWTKIEPIGAVPVGATIFDVEVDASGAVYALPQINPQKIYKSIDGGVTWNSLTSTGLPATLNSIRRIEILSNGSILAFGVNASLGRIYKSIDGGATFTLQFTSAYNVTYGQDQGGNSSRKPAISPTSGAIAIMGHLNEGLLVSTDNGTTWTAKSVASIATPTGFVGSYMYDKDGNLVLQSIVDTSLNPLWDARISKSTDNGTTWTTLPTPSTSNAAGTINYSKRVIVLGTGEYLMCAQSLFDCYRSSDGGATWSLIGNVGDVFLWAASQGTTAYIIGSGDAGILKTTDGGLTFSPFSQGIPHPSAIEINLSNNKDLVIGATRPYYSSDFGQNFSLATLQPAAKYLQVKDSLIGYGSRLLLKSKDGGKTWANFGTDRFLTFLTADATGNGFYGSNGTSLNYSTDLINWTNIVLSGLPTSYNISGMVIDQGGVIYAVVNDFIANTTDVYKIVFGSATKISSVIGTTNPSTIKYVNTKIYLYDTRGIIYKSADGEIWTQGSAPTGNSLVVANNYLFITASNSVLWLSRNDGGTWQSVGDIPPASGFVPIFRNIVINEYDGYAYATLTNSVAKKSGNMIIPDDKTKPVVTAYAPLNAAINVGLKPTLTLTFDEITKVVAGKLIRVFDLANQALPVATLDISTAVQNGKSWSIPTTTALSFNKTYFIVIDAGAVTDIFGNAYVGISASTTWRFTTKATPTVTALTPANNSTSIATNTTLKITFSEPMTGVAAKNVSLYKSTNTSTPVFTVLATAGVASGNDFTFTLPSVLEYNTSYFAKADAGAFQTVEGQAVTLLSANTDWVFTTRVAPTVVSTLPANNSTGIVLSTNLSITFSQSVTLVGTNKLYVTNTASPATPVATIDLSAASVSGATATFTLPSPLSYGTVYTVTFDANSFKAVSDGGTFSALTSTGWQFTTRSAPVVSSTTPANSSTGIALNTNLSMTFSENATLVASNKLYVTNTALPATPVATINLSAASVSGATATFTLPSPLSYGTVYAVTFDANSFKAVSDGGTFSALTSTGWQFTTVEAPDTQPPVISFIAADFTKGTTNKIQVSVTDNKTVTSTSLWYRGISTTSTYIEVKMSLNTSISKWEITVEDAWLDGMGLEYYFTAVDNSSNASRLPLSPGVFSSGLTFATATSPSITSGIIKFGGTASDYRIVSIPYKITDTKVSTIFNEVNSGLSDKKLWRLLTYGGGTKWNEYPADFQTITDGKGYWINILTAADIKIEGATTPDFDRFNLYSMTLNSGWNQIGNPYTLPISWNEIKTQNTNVMPIKVWNGAGYANGDILNPFEGGFVYVNGTSSVIVKVTFKGIPIGGRTQSSEIVSSDLGNRHWEMPIVISQGKYTNEFSGVGMSQDADYSFDKHDDLNAPRFINYLEMNFSHPEHSAKKFSRDVVPTQAEYTWDFSVDSNMEGTAEMTWDNTGFGENDKDLFLLDTQTQTLVNMRETGRFAFNPSESGKFKIFFGTNIKSKIKPSRVLLGKAYPNPSTGMTTIPFSLPDQATGYQVSLEVYDMLGKKINTLINGTFNPGFYNSEWDASLGGLTSGVYTYRLAVTSSSGSEVQSGKIIIKK